MSVPAKYAFAHAYQGWLWYDAHLRSALTDPHRLDGLMVREIGDPYQFDRTILEGQQDLLAALIRQSGQAEEMALEERAARLARALEQKFVDGSKRPASAATKLSWFVWPKGWTMYDSFTAKAVVGSPAETGVARMERFYAALAIRGLSETLEALRALIPTPFDPLLSERTVDLYLLLTGRNLQPGDLLTRRIEAFLRALPADVGTQVREISYRTAPVLDGARLLHADRPETKAELADRVKALRQMKEDVA